MNALQRVEVASLPQRRWENWAVVIAILELVGHSSIQFFAVARSVDIRVNIHPTLSYGWLRSIVLFCATWMWFALGYAHAGGGPENVLLLVNANSEASQTIAEHYARLRQIPDSNILRIDWDGNVESCSGEKFREAILKPALEAIRDRRLEHQIDYLIYSSDFPWLVDMRPDFTDENLPSQFSPVASLTGATYLWQSAYGKNPGIVSPMSNWYGASEGDEVNLDRCKDLGIVRSRGFRGAYRWTRNGQPTLNERKGRRYLLSTMLGVTSGRGNTVEEVIRYLDRSAEADATRPKGTIYFMRNSSIRSQSRHECYESAVAQLRILGVRSMVVDGVIPENRGDIQGLMVGAADFDWRTANNIILPGAICEHFTSFGGRLQINSAHAPLTRFLRYGAAGASGTVTEPYSIQAKFPSPSVHVHYVRGCSLAEAFYQSVRSPYQLLIVGDPLCQPWAIVPTVSLDSPVSGQKVAGAIEIAPAATMPNGRKVRMLEYFLDGRLIARSLPNRSITVDTTKLTDGPHELRVVAVDASPIETRGRVVVSFEVDNGAATDQADAGRPAEVASDGAM